MAEECNLADFVDCSPICSDISADSMLEALRAELKQAIGNDPTDPQKEPDEAQSALRPVAKESKEVGDAGTGNQPVLDQQTIVTAPAPEVALALVRELETTGAIIQRRRQRRRKTNSEGWMPAGWKMITKERQNGRTAGYIDKFYIAPSGRRCRSKLEVLQYISNMENNSRMENNSHMETNSHMENNN